MLYEVHYLDGSVDQLEATSVVDAKKKGAKLNPDIGVAKAILIENDDLDPDDEEEEQDEDSEGDLEDEEEITPAPKRKRAK